MKYIFNNKMIIIFFIVTVLAVGFSLTYAVNSEQDPNSIEGNIVHIDEEVFENVEFDSRKNGLIPILDEKVTENKNVIKIEFKVGGAKENNIDNIIYDISLTKLNLNCELLSPYLKWKLLKNGEMISSGSLDYKFDTITNGRMVLTPIQQELKDYSEDKTTYDNYEFYMWLSDSCQDEDISNCLSAEDQSHLTNKNIEGIISIELNVGAKKELVRNPSETLNMESCINESKGEN